MRLQLELLHNLTSNNPAVRKIAQECAVKCVQLERFGNTRDDEPTQKNKNQKKTLGVKLQNEELLKTGAWISPERL